MQTLLHRLAQWADQEPQDVALKYKRAGVWVDVTTSEYRDHVYFLALYLESRGFGPSDVGVIFSYNRPEWAYAEFAHVLLGGKSAGMYPNSNRNDLDFILGHTESRFLHVQNRDYFKKLGILPDSIECVIVFDDDASIHPKAVGISKAIDEGRQIAASQGKTLLSYLERLNPDAGAFLIYTSGTTGTPKGAMLSEDNMVFAGEMYMETWNLHRGTFLSFLPLSHVAQKVEDMALAICARFTVVYCSAFDNLSAELVEIQPTALLCVPRLWEKMREGVLAKLEKAPAVRRKLATWAMGVASRVADLKDKKSPIPLAETIQLELAQRLVLQKIRHALGLSRAGLCVSGAAALPEHVGLWFRTIGVEIQQILAQTENTAVTCLTELGENCLGTVGRPAPGTEFKLAADGEILTKGRHVFKGYFKNEAATRDALVTTGPDAGWLHTGDLGQWVEKYPGKKWIVVSGRKKEVMKSSGGKMVAPLPIEGKIKECAVVSQVCMVGDGRKYFSALITLNESTLSALRGKPGALDGTKVTDPGVLRVIQKRMDEVNASLASYERVKSFVVLPREFSIESGEMTPTLKMKRMVVEKQFAPLIEEMYSKHES